MLESVYSAVGTDALHITQVTLCL